MEIRRRPRGNPPWRVQRDVGDHFQYQAVVEPRAAVVGHGVGRHHAALLDQRAGKAGNCIVKCVGRLAGAGRGDGLCRQSGTFADQGVCAQAVLAAIGLTGSQRNDLALGGTQAAGAQRFGQAEVAVERCRRVGQRGEQVRHHAELGFDGLECGSGSGVSGVDGQGGDLGHVYLRSG